MQLNSHQLIHCMFLSPSSPSHHSFISPPPHLSPTPTIPSYRIEEVPELEAPGLGQLGGRAVRARREGSLALGVLGCGGGEMFAEGYATHGTRAVGGVRALDDLILGNADGPRLVG